MNEIAIAQVDRVDIVYEPAAWPFADARRGEIDRHFAERRRARPGIWNGRALLLHRHTLAGGEFRGACLETDYASFLAWRDWQCPDRSVHNCFAAAALRTADGCYLLGEMAAHTAGAGHVYFPCGTPEPADLVAGKVDLEGGMRREFLEETGLDLAAFAAEPGWLVVSDLATIAFLKLLQAREGADQLGERVRGHLARTAQPELAAVHFVRQQSDLARPLPGFVRAFLDHASRRKEAISLT
jgi:8-oxo-dGTP pyrophosphatase MutT (NUDIX family)